MMNSSVKNCSVGYFHNFMKMAMGIPWESHGYPRGKLKCVNVTGIGGAPVASLNQ